MRGNRKYWAEGFTLGLLVGVVAAVSCLVARPVPARDASMRLSGAAPARLPHRKAARHEALLLADGPSSSVH